MGTAIGHADLPPMPAPPPPDVPVLGDETQNYAYMYALDEGIKPADGNMAYEWGTGVCNALASGRTPDHIAQDWPHVNGAAIVSLAQQIYCPAA